MKPAVSPLSAGAPLSESDLKPMEEMGQEIRNWILDHNRVRTSVDGTEDPSKAGGGFGGAGGGEVKSASNSRTLASPSGSSAKSGYPSDAVDDLYEF